MDIYVKELKGKVLHKDSRVKRIPTHVSKSLCQIKVSVEKLHNIDNPAKLMIAEKAELILIIILLTIVAYNYFF